MVEFLGNMLSITGTFFAVFIDSILYDSFFPRIKSKIAHRVFLITWITLLSLLSIFIGNRFGYFFKISQELIICYVMCTILYQSRWDRRLFVIVTIYSVLFSSSYWFDTLLIFFLKTTYEKYIWNVLLYSTMLFLRATIVLVISLIIRKYHFPLSVGRQSRAWIPLSAVFPVGTLFVIWKIYTYPLEQSVWQFCLLILDVVDIVALLLLDHLEQSALNREKLVVASDRAQIQDENIQALSQAYASQRKLTHDYRTQLTTLSELLEIGNLDEAKSFLSELKVRHCERILLINSHNAAIDALLNQKGYIGRQRGIDMRFRVNDLSQLNLPRVDLTIVLGNLIDNAMEACLHLSESEKWVSIQLLYAQHNLSILIINPSPPVKIVNGQIPTSKSDPLLHGFGLINVKDILEKHQAEYSFFFNDGRFIFSIDWPDFK